MTASLPATWDAVLALAGTALGVEVVDGELGQYLAFDYFQLVDAQGSDVPATMGRPVRYDEVYSLNCLIRAYAGDVDHGARRARAWALYEQLRGAVNADPSLGGAVLRAYLTNYRFAVGATEKGGSAAHIEFAIEVHNQTVN